MRLVEGYYLYNGFYCYLDTNSDGELLNLIPYAPFMLEAYPISQRTASGSNIDTASQYYDGRYITQHGFYYKDNLGRNIPSDKIMALYNPMYKTDSLISSNDFGRQINFNALASANFFESVIYQLVQRQGLPQALISGVGGDDNNASSVEETEQVLQQIKEFYQDDKRAAMALPSGYTIKSLFDQHHPGPIFQVLSDVIATQIGNLFSFPKSLLNSVGDQAMIRHDRETYLSGSFLSLTRQISDQLNYISDSEIISFDIDGLKLKMQTSRDEHNMIDSLINSGLFSKEEILNKINL